MIYLKLKKVYISRNLKSYFITVHSDYNLIIKNIYISFLADDGVCCILSRSFALFIVLSPVVASHVQENAFVYFFLRRRGTSLRAKRPNFGPASASDCSTMTTPAARTKSTAAAARIFSSRRRRWAGRRPSSPGNRRWPSSLLVRPKTSSTRWDTTRRWCGPRRTKLAAASPSARTPRVFSTITSATIAQRMLQLYVMTNDLSLNLIFFAVATWLERSTLPIRLEPNVQRAEIPVSQTSFVQQKSSCRIYLQCQR